MFSHLTPRELAVHACACGLGLLLIITGVTIHGRDAFANPDPGIQPDGGTGPLGMVGSTTNTYSVTNAVSSTTTGTNTSNTGASSTSNGTTTALSVSVATQPGACGTGIIKVSWNIPGDGGTFRLYRNNAVLYEGNKREFEDRNLTPGTNNAYTVSAYVSGAGYGTGYNFGIAPPLCPSITVTNPPSASTTTYVPSTVPTTTPVAPYTGPVPVAPVPAQPVTVSTSAPRLPEPKGTVNAQSAPQSAGTPVPMSTPPGVSVERSVSPTPASGGTALSSTTEKKVAALFSIVSVFDETNKVRASSRRALVEYVERILNAAAQPKTAEDASAQYAALIAAHTALLTDINAGLDAPSTRGATLASDIQQELGALSAYGIAADAAEIESKVASALAPLLAAVDSQTKAVAEKGGESLYKDTNKDGISDYESVHVYNLDPVKPTPTSVYAGRKITAGEKVALGFDPSKTALVPVLPEAPEESPAPITASYTVSSVALNSQNKVALSGRALPNSFVTLYIYSTPIIVTVKTDADGTWQYTLSKELEDGNHKVSVATVDNSGRILAKSEPIPFTKTAQAATLDTFSTGFIASTDRPTFFSLQTAYLIGMVLVGIILLTLGILGLRPRPTIVADVPPPAAPPH